MYWLIDYVLFEFTMDWLIDYVVFEFSDGMIDKLLEGSITIKRMTDCSISNKKVSKSFQWLRYNYTITADDNRNNLVQPEFLSSR